MSDALEQAREKRAGLRAAMGEVERLLARPSAEEGWNDALRRGLQRMSDALGSHVAVTEAPDGLLEDVVANEPRLAHRAAQARNEHRRLETLVADALAAAGSGAEPGEGPDRVREITVELLETLVRHRHVGADLVYSAYSVDIEAAD